VLGVSFWLPVPTVRCACCDKQLEAQAAAAGFFGNAPLQPGVWFSTQLLDMYTPMFQAGLSATSLALSLSKVAACADVYAPLLPKLAGALLPIDDRCVPGPTFPLYVILHTGIAGGSEPAAVACIQHEWWQPHFLAAAVVVHDCLRCSVPWFIRI
jgi:hypothetical protein